MMGGDWWYRIRGHKNEVEGSQKSGKVLPQQYRKRSMGRKSIQWENKSKMWNIELLKILETMVVISDLW